MIKNPIIFILLLFAVPQRLLVAAVAEISSQSPSTSRSATPEGSEDDIEVITLTFSDNIQYQLTAEEAVTYKAATNEDKEVIKNKIVERIAALVEEQKQNILQRFQQDIEQFGVNIGEIKSEEEFESAFQALREKYDSKNFENTAFSEKEKLGCLEVLNDNVYPLYSDMFKKLKKFQKAQEEGKPVFNVLIFEHGVLYKLETMEVIEYNIATAEERIALQQQFNAKLQADRNAAASVDKVHVILLDGTELDLMPHEEIRVQVNGEAQDKTAAEYNRWREEDLVPVVLQDGQLHHILKDGGSVPYRFIDGTVRQFAPAEYNAWKAEQEAHKVWVAMQFGGEKIQVIPDERILVRMPGDRRVIMSPRELNENHAQGKIAIVNNVTASCYVGALVGSAVRYKNFCDDVYKKAVANIQKDKKLSVKEKEEAIKLLTKNKYKPTKRGAAVMAGLALVAPVLYKVCSSYATNVKAEYGV